MLKKIILFIVALIVLLLIIAALLPAEYRVERSITINAPVEKVFEQVVDLNNYVKWNPWSDQDPEAKSKISENSRGVGSVWLWDGAVIGKGELSIVKLDEGRSIETRVEFFEPMARTSSGFWKFEGINNSINVRWAFKGSLSYPVERYMGFFIDDM
ncbi:MAG: SRPBCC family protein, partial [Bacteroidota bacterium]